MNNILEDKRTLLKAAIKGEVDGYTYYNLLAEKTENKDAKRRLENLRDDEKRHKAILVDLYGKHIGGPIGELPEKGIGALATVFDKGKLKRLKTEQEYINLAIEAELASMKFYKESAEKIDDDEFRKILDNLSEEENSHYEILMAEKEAMAGNYYWFSAGDTAPMED
jgi:rubrerythrin